MIVHIDRLIAQLQALRTTHPQLTEVRVGETSGSMREQDQVFTPVVALVEHTGNWCHSVYLIGEGDTVADDGLMLTIHREVSGK